MIRKRLLAIGTALVFIGGVGIALVFGNQKDSGKIVEKETQSVTGEVEEKTSSNVVTKETSVKDENKEVAAKNVKKKDSIKERGGQAGANATVQVKRTYASVLPKTDTNYLNEFDRPSDPKYGTSSREVENTPSAPKPGISSGEVENTPSDPKPGTSSGEVGNTPSDPKPDTPSGEGENTPSDPKPDTPSGEGENTPGNSETEKPEENEQPQEVKVTGYKPWDVITVKRGTSVSDLRDMLPKEVTLQLSNQTEKTVPVEWKEYVNTWREGETTTVANYTLPEGVTGEKPSVIIRLNIVALKEAKLELDKTSYYYDDNPRITVVDLDNKSEISIQQNLEYSDKTLVRGEHYTYDESTGVIEINTHKIFKRDNKKFSTETTLDLTITVGGKTFPMKTITYNKSKSMYTLKSSLEDVRREGEIRIEVIGLEIQDRESVAVKIGEEDIKGTSVQSLDGNDYIVVPYESIRTLAENKEHIILTLAAPGYGSFNVTLNFEAAAVTAKAWNVEAIVNEYDGTVKTEEYGEIAVYPYNGQSTIKLMVKDSELTREDLLSKLNIKIKSGAYSEFTVPKSGTGAWSVDRQTEGLRIKIPTDQVAGNIEYRKNKNGQVYPVTTITLEVEGYEIKIIRVCVMY